MKKIIVKIVVVIFMVSILGTNKGVWASDNIMLNIGEVDNIVRNTLNNNIKVINNEVKDNSDSYNKNNNFNDLIYEDSMTVNEYVENKERKENKLTRDRSVNPLISNSDLENMIVKIYTDLSDIKTSIDISQYCSEINVSDARQIFDIYFAVLYERPELFYIPFKVSMSYAGNQLTGKLSKCILRLEYNYSTSEILTMKEKLYSKVTAMKDRYLKGAKDDLTKEYVIYDYLLSGTTYDYDNYLNNTIPDISHTAYGSLVNGIAVCDGYSKAAKLLFNEVGIESGIVTSDTMNHAWNYVKIDGKYYNLDLTWDDPVPETNKIGYRYFNISNEDLAKDHNWLSEYYPNAISNDFSFLRSKELTRVSDRLYFKDNTKKTIESINLKGENQEPVLTNMGNVIGNLVGYNNTLNFIENNIVKSYNVKSNSLSEKYSSELVKSSLYIKEDTLFMKNYSGLTESISLKINEDLNFDSLVDIIDLATISKEYNKRTVDLGSNKIWDLNGDGLIDIFDMVFIAKKMEKNALLCYDFS